MIEVTDRAKFYKAFYYQNHLQKEVQELINQGLADLLDCDLDDNGMDENLFLKQGIYKKTSCGQAIIPTTKKLVSTQRGNWIVIEYEKNDDIDVFFRCKMVSSRTMMKKYKALIENINITLEGYEIEPELFDDLDGVEIIKDNDMKAVKKEWGMASEKDTNKQKLLEG